MATAGRRAKRRQVSYAISHYKLSFWAAASAQRALAATVRARPPVGRARPSSLHIKKALASKWYQARTTSPQTALSHFSSADRLRILSAVPPGRPQKPHQHHPNPPPEQAYQRLVQNLHRHKGVRTASLLDEKVDFPSSGVYPLYAHA